jgi:hypothetical protein
LAQDVALRADGGGRVPTLRETLHGPAAVLGFVAESLRNYWHGWESLEKDLNDALGVVLRAQAETTATVSSSWNAQGQVDGIYIVRNPDKLASLVSPDKKSFIVRKAGWTWTMTPSITSRE